MIGLFNGKPSKMTQAMLDNVLTESFMFKRFKLIAINQHEWAGLPDTVEERYLERGLFYDGQMFAYNHKTLGPLCLPCQGLGTPNVYGEFLQYRVVGFNFTDVVNRDDGVLIENNKLRMPTSDIVDYFADQLSAIKRTRDVNLQQLKYQFLFAIRDKNETSFKRILEKIDNNEPAIITDINAMNIDDAVKTLNTGVKPMLAELTDTYHDVMNEALTYLGVNNANTDKRERLITDEANANNQFIECCSELFLQSRQKACKEMKEKLGWDVSVKLRVSGGDANAIHNQETTAKIDTADND